VSADFEQSKLERAAYIVGRVMADAEFIAETDAASEAADRGEGKSWEQVREEYGL
jgi:hypothetical protein